MDKVIVADAELRTSLAVIRSLSKFGLKIISISRSKIGGYLSNCIWKKFCVSGATDEEYYNFIINIAKIENVKAIFAHFEKTLLQLHKKISYQNLKFKLIMPPVEMLKLVSQKERTLTIAKEVGLPIPHTIYYDGNDNQNLYKIVKENIPCFIKTTVEIDIPPGPGNRYLLIKTNDDLKNLYEFSEKNKTLFIQEYIEGYGCGIGGVFYNGIPIAVGGHIRLRESYSSGGVSTYCESKIHKEVLNHAIRLMDKLKWTGIAMIEFKVTREGVPYFMEVNPRIWGSIPLYIKSGIDIPVIAYEILVNEQFNTLSINFKEGVKMRFMIEDFYAINAQYKGFKKLIEIIKVLFNLPVVKEGSFDIRDPLPFILPIIYSIIKRIPRKIL